jgi:hypothetical protein
MPLCHAHLNEYRRAQDKRRRGPAKRRGGKYQPKCKHCGEPRREGIQYALCAEHYREMLTQRARAKGIPPRQYFDPQKCTRCDEPRTQYGSLCLACDRAAKEAKRREMGIAPRAAAKPKVCRICGSAGPLATATGKLCVGCSEQRRAGNATKKKLTKAAVHKQRQCVAESAPPARRWNTAFSGKGLTEAVQKPVAVEVRDIVIGPEAFERPKPVDIRGHKVTRVPAAGEWGR